MQDDPRRIKFLSHTENLLRKLINYAPVDAAVDQKARDFLHDCLPPMLTPGTWVIHLCVIAPVLVPSEQLESENAKAQTTERVESSLGCRMNGQRKLRVASDSLLLSSADELASSVQGAPARWERGQVMDADARINTQTRVRILRAGCAR